MYKIELLPSARQDFLEIAVYIGQTLHAPKAAERLIERFSQIFEELSSFPYAYPAYHPLRSLQKEYRKVVVDGYLLFYWVSEDKKTVTIARVIYGKRDMSAQIE